MKASIKISTGKIIEAQSDGSDEVLTANAIAAGVEKDDIEIREINAQDLAKLIEASKPEVQPKTTIENVLAVVNAALDTLQDNKVLTAQDVADIKSVTK